MGKSTSIFEIEQMGLNKYEMVLLVARRARQINSLRVNLQKRFGIPLIEKDKPTNFALNEVFSGRLGYEYSKSRIEDSPIRGIKKF